jgi:hypothetical protein
MAGVIVLTPYQFNLGLSFHHLKSLLEPALKSLNVDPVSSFFCHYTRPSTTVALLAKLFCKGWPNSI